MIPDIAKKQNMFMKPQFSFILIHLFIPIDQRQTPVKSITNNMFLRYHFIDQLLAASTV